MLRFNDGATVVPCSAACVLQEMGLIPHSPFRNILIRYEYPERVAVPALMFGRKASMKPTAPRKNGALKIVASGVCLLALFVLVFAFCQNLLLSKVESKDFRVNAQTSYWHEYRSLEENTVDVLYVGSSIVYCGVDPQLVYEQTGITSYAFGAGSVRYDQVYLALKEALKTQDPKYVMLEASAFRYQGPNEEPKYHRAVDEISLSLEKLQVIAENDWEGGVDIVNFAFPLLRYHDRWDQVDADDFHYALFGAYQTYQRGHAPAYNVTPIAIDFYKEKENWASYPRNYTYMDKIVQLCQDEGIELIIFKVPSRNWNYVQSAAMQEYADSKGVRFIDYTHDYDAIGLDENTDFVDAIGHLNQYGSEKFTSYMTQGLLSTFGLPDHRGEYTRWDDDLEAYKEVKASWKEHAAEMAAEDAEGQD